MEIVLPIHPSTFMTTGQLLEILLYTLSLVCAPTAYEDSCEQKVKSKCDTREQTWRKDANVKFSSRNLTSSFPLNDTIGDLVSKETVCYVGGKVNYQPQGR